MANPVLVTASEVRAATKERCYDYGVIALALSDPAIQTLIVRKLVEAMSDHRVEMLQAQLNAWGRDLDTGEDLQYAGHQREDIVTLLTTRGPDHG